jgi:hypothetical protein
VEHEGRRHIVINCFAGGLVQVFKNDGAGRFSLTQTVGIPDGGIPHWITGADFNGDGFIDVATSNERSKTITVLTNDHHGNFAIAANFPATISAYGITAGDWDSDGRIDLVASSNDFNESAAVLFRNAGDSRFEPSYLVGKNVSYVPTLTRLDQTENIYLILSELSGDKMDIFSMQHSSFRLEWPLETGSWLLQEAQTPESGAWTVSTAAITPNPLKAANEVYLDKSDAHRFFRLAQ